MSYITDPHETLHRASLTKDRETFLPYPPNFQLIADDLGLPATYLGGESSGEAYGGVLVAGLAPGPFALDTHRISEPIWAVSWRATRVWIDSGSPQPIPLAVLHEYGRHILGTLRGRSFFMSTNKVFIGLCPDTAQKGDWICLLAGGEIPYIIRPRSGTIVGDKLRNYDFELVGKAYVRGIMDGELAYTLDERPVNLIFH